MSDFLFRTGQPSSNGNSLNITNNINLNLK